MSDKTELREIENEVMGEVLSRTGMRRYLNGDPLELNPSDLRDIVKLSVSAARRATIQPTAAASQPTPARSDDQIWKKIQHATGMESCPACGYPEAKHACTCRARSDMLDSVAPADAVRDAERYRWLTEEKGLRFSPSGGSAIRDLEEMNKHIDAEILAAKPTPKEPAK